MPGDTAHAWAQGRSLAQLHEVRLSEATRAALRRVASPPWSRRRGAVLWRDRPALARPRTRRGRHQPAVEMDPRRPVPWRLSRLNARMGDIATCSISTTAAWAGLPDLATYLRNCEIAFSSSCRELWTAFMGG